MATTKKQFPFKIITTLTICEDISNSSNVVKAIRKFCLKVKIQNTFQNEGIYIPSVLTQEQRNLDGVQLVDNGVLGIHPYGSSLRISDSISYERCHILELGETKSQQQNHLYFFKFKLPHSDTLPDFMHKLDKIILDLSVK